MLNGGKTIGYLTDNLQPTGTILQSFGNKTAKRQRIFDEENPLARNGHDF
jgi:hypothetical protein